MAVYFSIAILVAIVYAIMAASDLKAAKSCPKCSQRTLLLEKTLECRCGSKVTILYRRCPSCGWTNLPEKLKNRD